MQILENVVQQFQQILGAELGVSVQASSVHPPQVFAPGVAAQINIWSITIQNDGYFILSARSTGSPTLEQLQLWANALTVHTRIPVILFLDMIQPKQRQWLLRKHQSFITRSGEYFVPGLAIHFFTSAAKMRSLIMAHLPATATALAVVLIYASAGLGPTGKLGPEFSGGQRFLSNYGRVAGITSRPTLNRALVKLEESGLLTTDGNKTHKTYFLRENWLPLFYQIQQQLSNPVTQQVLGATEWLNQAIGGTVTDLLTADATWGADSALSQVSLLDDAGQKTVAVGPSDFKKLAVMANKPNRPDGSDGTDGSTPGIIVQRWAYSPKKLENGYGQAALIFPLICQIRSAYI